MDNLRYKIQDRKEQMESPMTDREIVPRENTQPTWYHLVSGTVNRSWQSFQS